MVESTIDLDEIANHNYVIKAEFDDGLLEIQASLTEAADGLNEEHERVAGELGFETDGKVLHFESNNIYGHIFRLTRKVSFLLF